MSDPVSETTVLTFSDKYCTTEQAAADPEGTKNKLILSNGDYATCEMLGELKTMLNIVAFKLGRGK
jgi:hypothetical protein